jgi:hypothetical protein
LYIIFLYEKFIYFDKYKRNRAKAPRCKNMGYEESEEIGKKENEGENKEVEKEKEILKVNTVYYQHIDDTSTHRWNFLLIEIDDRKYFIFEKDRIAKSNIFYIPLEWGYIKLWQDSKKNILFYISKKPFEIFAKNIEIQDYTYIIANCNKEIEISGPLKKFLEVFNNLEEIIKILICGKFEF